MLYSPTCYEANDDDSADSNDGDHRSALSLIVV